MRLRREKNQLDFTQNIQQNCQHLHSLYTGINVRAQRQQKKVAKKIAPKTTTTTTAER